MTVAIDPSDIRRQDTVKGKTLGQPSGRLRLPLRTLLLGGLGGAGLLAFTIGAFSFFGGLADPRVRTIRPVAVAKMPDLKDGLPALVSESGTPPPAATVLNLPKPPAAEPLPARPEIALRTDTAAEPVAPASPSTSPAPAPSAEASGSAAQRKAAPVRAKASPTIENAATVSGDAKPVPLIAPARTAGPLAPAKAETVRAKAVAVAALPSEPEPAAAPAQAAHEGAIEPKIEPKPAAARKPAQKVARAKAKPVTEASAEPEAAPEPEEGFDAKVGRGIRAIEGLFGRE